MKKILAIFLLIIITMCTITACNNGSASSDIGNENSESNLNIVTTIFPPYDFAKQITGGKSNIHLLLSPGSESHTYEPTPSDIIKIQKSDVFIYVGGENDVWVDDILKSMDTTQMSIIRLMDYVDLKEEEIVEGMTEVEEEDNGEIEYDEHIWTSPKNAITLLETISKKLQELRPENAQEYKENTTAYSKQISDLQKDIKQTVDKAANKTIVFADRFPFKYFADEFGLKYYAAFPGCGTDTEPSAATIAFLIDKVKNEKIPAVYYLEFSSHKIADTICKATGAKELLFHSCHNVSSDDMENGATYVSLMRQNLENLKQGLGVE